MSLVWKRVVRFSILLYSSTLQCFMKSRNWLYFEFWVYLCCVSIIFVKFDLSFIISLMREKGIARGHPGSLCLYQPQAMPCAVSNRAEVNSVIDKNRESFPFSVTLSIGMGESSAIKKITFYLSFCSSLPMYILVYNIRWQARAQLLCISCG